MNKKMTVSIVGFFILSACAYLVFAYPTIFPTGTTIFFPDECYKSYILVADHASLGNHPSAKIRAKSKITDDIRLIDMNGNVVHTWNVVPNFNKRCRLMPNGHLLYVGPNETIYEYDWDGNIVWTHEGIDSMNDMRWLPNNNRLFVAHEPLPEYYQKQVKDVEISPWWPLRKRGSEEKQLGGDIYEVTPDKKIVWEWHAYDHLDLNRFSPVTPEGDWLHMNTISPIPENKWYDNGDKRFKPGNILINPRNIDTLFIVDKDTKEIVWEWTHNYKGGLSHCHEPEMIEKGLPGAGNIILFDNGLFPRHRTHCGQTFIIEFDPTTKEIVWKYETEGYANLKFFSKTMGTQKRLPNGNTFISEDNTGRLFQVKPDGEIVWEYVNRGGTCRPFPVAYDFCPQLKAFNPPPEIAVIPPNNLEWHVKPEVQRDRSWQKEQSLSFNVEKELKKWVDMWNSYDLSEVKRLFLKDERLTYFSSEKEGIIRGFQSVLEHHKGFGFTEGGKKQPNRLWIEDLESDQFGTSAVVTGVWFFKRGGEGEGQIQKGPVTFTYVLENQEFRIAHVHFANYIDK